MLKDRHRTHVDVVNGPDPGDRPGGIVEDDGAAVLDVGGGGRAVVLVVHLAGHVLAHDRRHPQVAGAGVEHHAEDLPGGADEDVAVVLGVQQVVEVDGPVPGPLDPGGVVQPEGILQGARGPLAEVDPKEMALTADISQVLQHGEQKLRPSVRSVLATCGGHRKGRPPG